MEITITPEAERRLAEVMTTGRFVTASDAVAEGLRLLLRDDPRSAEREGALGAWIAALDDAPTDPDGPVPAHMAALLDMGADDVRSGRLVSADEMRISLESKIAHYRARRANGAE